MIGRIFKTFIGFLILPVAIGAWQAFYGMVSNISLLNGVLHILEKGILCYLLFHVLVIRPVYIYVLGHEFVHVIATWLCGGKVAAFKVTPSGGNVVTTKTNFFIELSPYFVPLYTILLGVVYMGYKWTGQESVTLSAIFVFLVGLTLTFHFVMTVEALRIKQSDIGKSGPVFSYILIFISNLIVVMSVFCLIFNDLSFIAFIKNLAENSWQIYLTVYAKAPGFVNKIKFW
ncbi:MAG: M50 family metallopeptidase [Candidatus Omnitrophica bacterium]|nr:M50 family metallopeptidase [Candidatus Omnitrophota bacterium]